MERVLEQIEKWQTRSEPVALATVVQTWGASPRGVGAKMVFTARGDLAGSVSGGCVETAVIDTGTEVLQTGQPQLVHFGVSDETAWSVGLSCGGSLDVFVEPITLQAVQNLRALETGAPPLATVTVIGGESSLLGKKLLVRGDGSVDGSLDSGLDEAAVAAARGALEEGRAQRARLSPAGGGEPAEVFIEVLASPPTLIMVGGVHIAIALTSIAKTLGYRTIVIDPRRVFGSEVRFAHADQLIQAWPDDALKGVEITSSTAIAMLTHDPKIDEPALQAALPSRAYYVGALGSATTQAKRRKRLLESGMPEHLVDRLHAPIGLDIGARTPEEIALSIMAQIVAARPQKKKAEKSARAS